MGDTAREIIHLQVGKAGNAIGHEFWRDLCVEHKIDYETPLSEGRYTGKDGGDEQLHIDVFFNEGNAEGGKTRYVPRCMLIDLNMMDLQVITQTPLGSLYRPDNVIGNDEGSGNCYAKAFHTEGPDLADRVLDGVRKEVERCNCLQGIQFTHNLCGGTGSGLTGLLLKTLYDFLDKGSKCILQSFCIVPSPGISDVLLEPYNAALVLEDLVEYCHQVFFFDNAALTDICQKTLEIEIPKMNDLNNIVARCMSGLTVSLRFPGILDADLRKIHSNIVPFKTAHFLITGFAPLTAASAAQYRKVSILDLTQQMISKGNVTCRCDPLNPGDPREGIEKARFLASFAAFRGNIMSSEVDEILSQMQQNGSRYDKFFPDWIPNAISSSICNKPHADSEGPSVTFVSNSTAVHEVFDRIITTWDSMYKNKAFLHVFENDGISTQDMMESRNVLQYISDQYIEFSKWPDKFFEDDDETTINLKAVLNEEQQGYCEELKELKECYISSRTTPGGRA
eukprot:GEMP01022440.1.p1 GENE.GEMP01022440.1~~GEMP01022440.1.p1  ORF type:complete len:508 (+),score=91.00 GEMP01022440.1:98-1621(+)